MTTRRDRIAEIAQRRLPGYSTDPVPGCAGLTQEQLDRNMSQAIADAENDPETSEADTPPDEDDDPED